MSSPFAGLQGVQPEIPAAPTLPAWAQRYPFTQPPAKAAAPRGPGLLGRLFGGADPTRGGLLDPLAAKQLGAEGLTDAGLAILEASGRGAGIGQLLAAGVRGGRQGYQQGFESQIQSRELARGTQMQQRRQDVMAKYAGKTDVASLQGMLADLIAMGDIEAAKPLAGYLNAAVNAQAGERNAPKPLEIKTKNAAGEPVTALVDPVTHAVLAEYPSTDTRSALDDLTKYQTESLLRQDRRDLAQRRATIYDDFRQDTKQHTAAAQGFAVLQSAMTDPKNAASPIALLYAYGKLLDPGSVVREGELATLQKIGSYDQRIASALQQAATGTMAPEIRQYIFQQAKAIAQGWASSFEDYVATAKTRAQDAGVTDIEARLTNPFKRYGLGGAPATSNPLLQGGP